jgi:hypothetical protein
MISIPDSDEQEVIISSLIHPHTPEQAKTVYLNFKPPVPDPTGTKTGTNMSKPSEVDKK